MTSVVGILCREGVVIGTDSSVTYSQGTRPTIEQPTEKITTIADQVIIAGTGQVGLSQRFCHVVETVIPAGVLNQHPVDVGKTLCAQACADFGATGASKGSYGALVAFPAGGRAHLCEFGLADFQPELKDAHSWFVSMGSAQYITDTFLAFLRGVYWPDRQPSVSEGIFATVWTLDLAIKINPGGVNGPPCVAVLEQVPAGGYSVRRLAESDLLEHRGHIAEAISSLTDLGDRHRGVGVGEIPPVPKPT